MKNDNRPAAMKTDTNRPPPPTHSVRKGAIGFRMHQDLVDALDAYAEAQDPPVSRTRALEHLLAWALNAAGHAPRSS